jgi:hypothetical protein
MYCCPLACRCCLVGLHPSRGQIDRSLCSPAPKWRQLKLTKCCWPTRQLAGPVVGSASGRTQHDDAFLWEHHCGKKQDGRRCVEQARCAAGCARLTAAPPTVIGLRRAATHGCCQLCGEMILKISLRPGYSSWCQLWHSVCSAEQGLRATGIFYWIGLILEPSSGFQCSDAVICAKQIVVICSVRQPLVVQKTC